MNFDQVSRRRILQGTAALTVMTALPVRPAAAKDTTVGFIYVGSRDDYGYQRLQGPRFGRHSNPSGDRGTAPARPGLESRWPVPADGYRQTTPGTPGRTCERPG
jgi:hypothetical protein